MEVLSYIHLALENVPIKLIGILVKIIAYSLGVVTKLQHIIDPTTVPVVIEPEKLVSCSSRIVYFALFLSELLIEIL